MDEVSAACLVLPHVGARCRSHSVRVSACMALFTLGCRQGLAVCTAEGVWDGMCEASVEGLQLMVDEAGSVSAAGAGVSTGAFDVACASVLMFGLLLECLGKCLPNLRVWSLDATVLKYLGAQFACGKALTDDVVLKIFSLMVDRKTFEADELRLVSGRTWGGALLFLPHLHRRAAGDGRACGV